MKAEEEPIKQQLYEDKARSCNNRVLEVLGFVLSGASQLAVQSVDV